MSSKIPRPPRPTLFPYTTLFRSSGSSGGVQSTQFVQREDGRPDDAPANRQDTPQEQSDGQLNPLVAVGLLLDRKSTRLNSSHLVISYAVFCLKKKKTNHSLENCT